MNRAMNQIRQASFGSMPAAMRAAPFGSPAKTRVARDEIGGLHCVELGYTARDYRHMH